MSAGLRSGQLAEGAGVNLTRPRTSLMKAARR